MKRFLIFLLVFSLFIIPVNALEYSVSAYFHYNDVLLPIQELNNPYDSFTNINTFDIYIPLEISQVHSRGSLVISGAIDLDLSNSSGYDLSNLYPTVIGLNADSDFTYQSSYDLSQYYNPSTGQLIYNDPSYLGIYITSQSSIVDNHFIYNFIIVNDRPVRRSFDIRFVSPSISGMLRQEASFYNATYVDDVDSGIYDQLSDLTSINTGGFTGVTSAVNALASIQSTNFATTSDFLSELSDKLTSLDQNMTDNVKSALEEWETENLNNSKSELTGAVDDVQDQIGEVFDFSDIQEATTIIYDAVSSDSMDPQLDIPAFTLNLFGQTFTFWEDIHFDFQFIYNTLTSITVFNILLTVFRFTIVVGCIYYCWYWLNKLINLVLLESDGAYFNTTKSASDAYYKANNTSYKRNDIGFK